MTVCVVGSRTFTDRARLFATLDALREEIGDFSVISGEARGADRFAKEWAHDHGLPYEGYPADWQQYGKAAGPIRNRQMVEAAGLIIAFHDGMSPGTASTIAMARAAGKAVAVHTFAWTHPRNREARP